jgi:hypothetical protein
MGHHPSFRAVLKERFHCILLKLNMGNMARGGLMF